MKKVFFLFLILLIMTSMCSCYFVVTNNNNSNSNSKPNNDNKHNDTMELYEIDTDYYPTYSILEDGVDYIDHSTTYDNTTKSFEYDTAKWYVNDLNEVPLPDPHIFYDEASERYYIYGTTDTTALKTFHCYSTQDFNEYKFEGNVFESQPGSWEHNTEPELYAPEMYCFDGVYYLYYSALNNNNRRYNSVVRGTSPVGPFEYIDYNNPQFNGSQDRVSVLDATIFVDDDNQMYMYYVACGNNLGNQHIVGVKMINPYTPDWNTRREIVHPGYINSSMNSARSLTWEIYHSGSYKIAEAPYMIKSPVNGKYYISYSVNSFDEKYYNICYAVSDTPLGNFVKPYTSGQNWTNLLVGYPGTNVNTDSTWKKWSGFASGVGHHSFFKIGDQWMISYHAHQDRGVTIEYSGKRYVSIDYIYFDNQGTPFCNGPTWSIEPLPEAISGYTNIVPNATILCENVENIEYVSDNYIVDCSNLIQEANKEVILGEDLSFIKIVFDKDYLIGGISIYNSGYYDHMFYSDSVDFIDFGNEYVIYSPQFCSSKYVDDDKKFIFPCSALTVEFTEEIESNYVLICFNTEFGAQINEIKVYGREV